MDRKGHGELAEETSGERSFEQLERLIGYDGPDKIVNWTEYLKERELNKDNSVSFQSGYTELDSTVENFQTGELITISGNTGMGKTLFLKSIVRGFGLQHIPVTVFSFEDPTSKFLDPFNSLENCHSIYVPKELKTGSYKWLEDKSIEAKLKFDNKIIVIDHLHYIVDMNVNRNFSLNIGAAMRFLKSNIAIKLNQIVFIVCHQEKMGEDQEPSLNGIRDSSFIGQESDMVFIVNRNPDEIYHKVQDGVTRIKHVKIPPGDWTFEKGYTNLKIEKARRSGAHKKKLSFVKKGYWLEAI